MRPLDSVRGPAGPAPARSEGGSERLRRHQRLTRSALFEEAYASGLRWVGRHMVLCLRAGEGAALRLGVVAGRKVGRAVARSRAKRRLREVFRRNRARLTGPYDVVLVARKSLVEAPWPQVVEDFLKLARRAGLFGEAHEGGGTKG